MVMGFGTWSWDWGLAHGFRNLVMALGPCPWVEVLPPGFRASLVALGPFLGVLDLPCGLGIQHSPSQCSHPTASAGMEGMAPAQDHKPWERLRKSWDKPQEGIWDHHPPATGNTKIRSTRPWIFRNIFIKTHCKHIFVQVFLGLHPETSVGITASCKSQTKHSSMTKNSQEQDEHPAPCGRQGTKLSCSKLWDSPVPGLRRPWIKKW